MAREGTAQALAAVFPDALASVYVASHTRCVLREQARLSIGFGGVLTRLLLAAGWPLHRSEFTNAKSVGDGGEHRPDDAPDSLICIFREKLA